MRRCVPRSENVPAGICDQRRRRQAALEAHAAILREAQLRCGLDRERRTASPDEGSHLSVVSRNEGLDPQLYGVSTLDERWAIASTGFLTKKGSNQPRPALDDMTYLQKCASVRGRNSDPRADRRADRQKRSPAPASRKPRRETRGQLAAERSRTIRYARYARRCTSIAGGRQGWMAEGPGGGEAAGTHNGLRLRSRNARGIRRPAARSPTTGRRQLTTPNCRRREDSSAPRTARRCGIVGAGGGNERRRGCACGLEPTRHWRWLPRTWATRTSS